MPITKAERAEWARNNRAQCKAREICTGCYKKKAFKLKLTGKPTKVYSRCKECLRSNAWFQSEYRERKNDCTKHRNGTKSKNA